MYKEVIHNISIFEKKKSSNQDRIKTLEKENSKLTDKPKKPYKLKNQIEKSSTEASSLIATKKETKTK